MNTPTDFVTVQINTRDSAGRKLADVALVFGPSAGPLAGLKLIGFGLWQRAVSGGYNVTFPARPYNVGGEKRAFALLRPAGDPDAQNAIRALIIDAYTASLSDPSGQACQGCGAVQDCTPDCEVSR